ncbi:MAG TPA: hypothetical protein PLO37_07250 [Candidatus Hydrogenedentes bacterium]|nr:hypothetical protein [Candidatus Hydrogenedentota bacterium]HPG66627.1 hypothetical protein [Candidatus Hydrogenedentota bacterium]
MKPCAYKLVWLAAFNAALGMAFLVLVDMGRDLDQCQTDSVLLAMPQDTQFDLAILGSSRAKLFTRIRPNIECLERTLGTRVFGMATPFGGGIVPAKLYLDSFYAQGNRADTVLLFLDPFMLFCRGPNEGHKLVYWEPFRFSFFVRMVREGFDYRRLVTYIRSKFLWNHIAQKPIELGRHDETLSSDLLDPERMSMRMNSLYPDGLDPAQFTRYAKTLRDVIATGQRQGARMIIAFAPTLLGDDPGRPMVAAFLDELQAQHEFEVYDFTHAVADPGLFADYDHLNSAGVEEFVSRTLKPLLRGQNQQ